MKLDKLISKLYKARQRVKGSGDTSKGSNVGALALPDVRPYYKAVVVKTG